MVKKRFIIDDDGIVTDMVDLSMHIDNDDCCEKLNELSEENEQLKTQIKIFEKFLDANDLDIDWDLFCTVDECKKDSDDYGCKECKYLGDVE